MSLLRKLNRILIMLLLLMLSTILYDKVRQAPATPTLSVKWVKPRPTRMATAKDEIPVVICASHERVGGTMATINSIRGNTGANLFFYIVTLRDTSEHVRKYLEDTELRDLRYKILEFNPIVLKGKVRPDSSRPELLHPLNFVRYYLPLLVPSHKRVIYLDDDVIVQGNIEDLFQTTLEEGHAAAFASDCDLPATHEMVRSVGMQTTYMGFLDYRKDKVRELGINPNECTFNTGVFVADLEEWMRQRITKQLEKLMVENFKYNLYSSTMAGGVASPPMLIVFYKKYSDIDPLWHVRHLGWSPNTRYSEAALQEAHLLHWNGRFKPWDYPCVYTELWQKWYIPDPTGQFSIVCPKS